MALGLRDIAQSGVPVAKAHQICHLQGRSCSTSFFARVMRRSSPQYTGRATRAARLYDTGAAVQEAALGTDRRFFKFEQAAAYTSL